MSMGVAFLIWCVIVVVAHLLLITPTDWSKK
jgi:hypothetical protein